MSVSDWARHLYRWMPARWLENHLRGGDCLVLCDDPPIFYVRDWVLESHPGALLPVFRRLRHKPVHLLVGFSWCRENAWHVARLARWQREHQRHHVHHRVIFMANTEVQHQALSQAGLQSVFVNHNAFVDPGHFKPLPGREKRFDAVYDARVSAFKRHELARNIDSLALIASVIDRLHDAAHVRATRDLLAHAHWYNDPLAADYRFLGRREINEHLNECRVGLCLSAEEGAMKASMQYLLAGLPLVSTISKGGRDVFFDPDYCRIVADDPRAVAEAVRALCDHAPPPEEIRARTLRKIEDHKQRLFELLDRIMADTGCRRDPRAEWDAWTGAEIQDMVTPAFILERIAGQPGDAQHDPPAGSLRCRA